MISFHPGTGCLSLCEKLNLNRLASACMGGVKGGGVAKEGPGEGVLITFVYIWTCDHIPYSLRLFPRNQPHNCPVILHVSC